MDFSKCASLGPFLVFILNRFHGLFWSSDPVGVFSVMRSQPIRLPLRFFTRVCKVSSCPPPPGLTTSFLCSPALPPVGRGGRFHHGERCPELRFGAADAEDHAAHSEGICRPHQNIRECTKLPQLELQLCTVNLVEQPPLPFLICVADYAF